MTAMDITDGVEVMTAKEAQAFLRMKNTKFHALLNAGKLVAYHDGGRIRVLKSDAMAYLRSLPPARPNIGHAQ